MNILSRYRFSLTAISFVVCPLIVSFLPFPQVVLGSEVQESRSHLGLVAQGIVDWKTEADQIYKQGFQLYQARRYPEALSVFQKALQLYRETKDLKGEAKSLNSLGVVYDLLGQYKKSIEYNFQVY